MSFNNEKNQKPSHFITETKMVAKKKCTKKLSIIPPESKILHWKEKIKC